MDKIKEIINKILGKGSDSSSDNSGFTLVELLIVIAVIGILAAALLVAIDPIDRINSATDANTQQNLSAVANAVEAYAVTHNGVYPTDINTLVTTGDLRAAPAGITVAANGVVYATMLSKKYSTTPRFLYSASNGKKCFVAASVTTCP